MADYVVRMTGQDNLSGTIKQVKSELNDLGKTTSKLDQIDAKFSKITNSTAPLKKQLRDLKTLMAQMNMDGLANTEQYTKIAQEAGKIKDAMDDAAASARRFSSDTASLDATIQAFQGIAAVGTIATGAMGLFGKENKEVEQAILKVQSALAILNGIQQVANVLNRNSALIEKLKGIALRSNTAATVTNTAATAANTTATVASTAATQAWNVAKAIGKALLGDWTGLLLVGGAALATYALTTSSAADAQEDLNKKNEEGTSIEKKAIESASEKIAKLRTLYSVTQDQTRSLQERNAAANEMRAMNPDILSGLSNEAILAGDAADAYNDMADAIIRIAMAEAAYDRIKELTKELLELEEADRKFNESDLSKGLSNLSKQREEAAQSTGQTISNNPTGKVRNPRRDEIEGEIGYLTKTYGSGIVNSIIGGNRRPSGFGGRYRRGGSVGGSGTTTPPPNEEEVKGIINVYEKEIQDLKNELNSATDDIAVKTTKENLDKKLKEYSDWKIEVGLEVDPEIEKKEEAREKIQEQIDQIYSKITPYSPETSSYEKAMAKYEVPDKSSQLNAIKEEMAYNDNLIDQLKELITLYDQLGDTGGIQKAANQIEELNKRQIELANSAQSIQEYKPNWDKFNEGADSFFNLTGSINGVVGSIDTLDKKIRDGANGWEVFMAAVSVAQGVLEGVQTVMTVVNAIQEVFNTKKAISAATSTTEAGAVTAAATAEQAKAAVDTGSIAAATASTAAVKAQEAALLEMAAAAIFAAHAFIPFAGVGIASGYIAAMMATMTSQSAASLALAAFANGGVVGGGSYYGDHILARVNAGEMVLNRKQQSNLFRAIESGDIGAGHTVLVPEFKIKGSDLYGTLRNFSKSVGKTGKVTGIR